MNATKPNLFPLDANALQELVKIHPTPFYLYDEALIREHARRFRKAFSILPNFREFFAVIGDFYSQRLYRHHQIAERQPYNDNGRKQPTL